MGALERVMYEYAGQDGTFGVYGDEAVAEDARGHAFRSVGKLAGSLARALMTRRAARQAEMGQMAAPIPCPDARPGTPPAETPCAKRARELRERAAARYGGGR